MGLRKKAKKVEAKSDAPATTPAKSVDTMIDEAPAHYGSSTREYIRQLIKHATDDQNVTVKVKKGKK